MTAHHRLVAPLVLLLLAASCGPPPEEADLLVTGVTVLVGRELQPRRADLAVRGDRILAIAEPGSLDLVATEILDGAGAFVVPGLWDLHVHLRAAEDAAMDPAVFLDHGVTSVRDVGGVGPDLVELRRAVAAGEMPGPTIYTALETLNGSSYAPFQLAVTDEEEVRRALAGHAAAGADLIKIHRALRPELLPAVVEAAAEHGLGVTGHIPLGMAPVDACRAGMAGIEHVGSILEAHISVDPALSASEDPQETALGGIEFLLGEASGPLVACLVERDVLVTPTLVVYAEVARRRSADGEGLPWFEEFLSGTRRGTLRLHEAGVRLAAGTDTSDLEIMEIRPGSSLLDELELLQEAGLAPGEVLLAATREAADAVGAGERTGTLTPGMAADFVVLRQDPLEDVGHLRDPLAVVQAGRVVRRGGP